MFGYDHEFSPQLLVGVTAGFASGRLTQDSDEINVKDYRAGIYTGSRFGRLTLNSMLMGGFQQYKSSRYTEIAGSETLSRADFNGYSAEFDLNLGYDLCVCRIGIILLPAFLSGGKRQLHFSGSV